MTTTLLIITNLITAIALIATVMYYKMQNNDPTILEEYTSSKPISFSLTEALIENFKNQPVIDESVPATTISTTPPFMDSRSAWVSFTDLKKYMSYIELLAASKGMDQIEQLGIRMYFGRYPNAADWSKFPELAQTKDEYKNLRTLVFVPTYLSGNLNRDFDPNYIENAQKLSIADIKARLAPTTNGQAKSAGQTQSPQNYVNLNNFGIIPPPFSTNGGAEFLNLN
jgi:hypothetical protein